MSPHMQRQCFSVTGSSSRPVGCCGNFTEDTRILKRVDSDILRKTSRISQGSSPSLRSSYKCEINTVSFIHSSVRPSVCSFVHLTMNSKGFLVHDTIDSKWLWYLIIIGSLCQLCGLWLLQSHLICFGSTTLATKKNHSFIKKFCSVRKRKKIFSPNLYLF